ncbi:MAG: inorganic diphosphatase [Gemmatimonadota bacterium]|nr:inorganic diphosphatase [Gemmatimonadota bacterium]
MTLRRPRRAPPLSELDTFDDSGKRISIVIETPKGARTKLAYDAAIEAFVVKKVLPEGMTFPFDFGFIPSTMGQDGDPLDVLVLMDEPVGSGSVVPARLIGVIEARQTEQDGSSEENDRLVAVSDACQLFADVTKLADLPESVTTQIERFFVSYNAQEGKTFKPLGRHGRHRARADLDAGRRKFQKKSRSK